MAYEFKIRRLVEFADTDTAGIVHFANYFRYMEAVEHAFFRSLGLSVMMPVNGKLISFPRVHVECDYSAPLRFEDEVELHLLVREMRTKSIVFDVSMARVSGQKRQLVARGSATTVCVVKESDGTIKSTAIPAELREKIEPAPPELLTQVASDPVGATRRVVRREQPAPMPAIGQPTGSALGPEPRRVSETHAERAAIEAEQLPLLQRLLCDLRTNPFYGPRIQAAGLAEGPQSIAEFCLKMPWTTREELIEDQSSHAPYGSNLTYPLERYTRVHATSGTSSAPLRWLDTPESWQWMLDIWKMVYAAAGIRPGDRIFFGFSFGPFLGFWMAFEAALQLGLMCLPGGALSSSARLRMILENRATVLCCTPTYALRLAEVAAESGIDLTRSQVRRIIVAGEPGGSILAARQRIESLWPGARVFDHHGMSEVGPVTYECPGRPCVLRVIESAYLAEMIDPQTLEPVGEDGQVGELVLTNFGRFGSPLLRYRTGDLVRPLYLNAEGDGPGPYLSLDGGIIGRVDDMVVVRGVNVFPSMVDQIIRMEPQVAEYRVEVDNSTSMTELTVYVEPSAERTDTGKLARGLQAAFRDHLSLRVPVQVVELGSLPRFEMKARRWVIK